MSPARRRLLVRLGVVALVLTVVVIVPGYIASQPQFLSRYPDYEARLGTWETSVHAKVPCQTCHRPPGLASQTAFSARMLSEFYMSFVLRGRQPDLLDTPSNESCAACHIDMRTVSPSGDLSIPHRAHIDVVGLRCVECHEFLVHEESPEGKHVPRMVQCLTCHDGEQAEDGCATCHTDKVPPDSHASPEWLVTHPIEQGSADCESCHDWTDGWCAECHSRRPDSHVEMWRSEHRFAVENRRNCEACHAGEFCIRCHGEVPALNYDPAIKLVE